MIKFNLYVNKGLLYVSSQLVYQQVYINLLYSSTSNMNSYFVIIRNSVEKFVVNDVHFIVFCNFSDLEGLKTTAVRSAYSDPQQPPDVCYLKSDVETK